MKFNQFQMRSTSLLDSTCSNDVTFSLFPDASEDLNKLGELIHHEHARFESDSSGIESDSAEEDGDDEYAGDGDNDDELEAE
jgi:hypothetical protein